MSAQNDKITIPRRPKQQGCEVKTLSLKILFKYLKKITAWTKQF